jgi:hypothetical protein
MAWKNPAVFFHSVENFFHSVEVPDFSPQRAQRSLDDSPGGSICVHLRHLRLKIRNFHEQRGQSYDLMFWARAMGAWGAADPFNAKDARGAKGTQTPIRSTRIEFYGVPRRARWNAGFFRRLRVSCGLCAFCVEGLLGSVRRGKFYILMFFSQLGCGMVKRIGAVP